MTYLIEVKRISCVCVGVWVFFPPFLVFDILCAVTIICTFLISKFRKKINITVFLPHFQYT